MAAAAIAVVALLPGVAAHAAEEPLTTTVRITSPLGRTGLDGPIRIVAQVQHPKNSRPGPVKFFVDRQLLGTSESGPPYAIEWTDENPYEPREIVAELCSDAGDCVRDTVVLPALEITEVSEVVSVLVEASVQDRTGRYIGGLGLADFRLQEDGEEQTIDLVHSDAIPSTYTLLIDCSQSMARRIDFVQTAAAKLLRYLRPEDKVIVAPFTKTFGSITGPTDDLATVKSAIAATHPGGGTAVLDTIARLPELLSNAQGRQAVILITDGYDEHSTVTVEEAGRAAKAAQATLFVVGIGGAAGISLKGERALKAIAEQSGGRAFFPTRDEELPNVHERIAGDIQQRYLLAYTPANYRIDGGWRTITLTTADPTLSVRARPGYFAPKPPPVRATIEFVINRETDAAHTIGDGEEGGVNAAGVEAEAPAQVSSSDLQIIEDGVEQTLDAFHEAVAPLSIILAIDASGSMKNATDAVKDAAKSFVHALRPGDELALLLFADEAATVHDLTTNRDSTLRAIDDYVAKGGTALHDAVWTALGRLERVERRRAIVVMTDGRDENNPGTAPGSRHTLAQVLERVRDVEAAIYTIGLGPRVDRSGLEQLARASGGESFFPESTQTLAAEYVRVVDHLRQRYVASFVSTNHVRDGAWRRVEIVSRVPGITITSRGGYFAPKD
jgi:VWFA-related protein